MTEIGEGRRIKQRRLDRVRQANGKRAESYANQLLRGDQLRHRVHHHEGVRHILGGSPKDGLTVSRVCSDDCPESWLGWDTGNKNGYRVCVPAHYVLEPLAANHARR